jgi:hypothetical protein
MLPRTRIALTALLGLALVAGTTWADLTDSLKKGTPDLKSIGPLAFGPAGVLFVGDPSGAAIFAIDTGDRGPATETGAVKMENVDAKIASLLGIDKSQILIRDLAVNPASGNIYLSVSRGTGPDAAPVLLRLDRKGKMEEVALKDVKFAKATLPNAAEGKSRQESITCLAYVKNKVIVAGLSNEDFASRLRVIPFPFSAVDKGTGVQIYHGGHGRLETNAPVRTFVPYQIKGEDHVLAAYTCTPLVKFPVAELKPGEKVKGTTVAEMGQGNRPLDMIIYEKGGKNYLLIANSARGVMKMPLEGVDTVEPVSKPTKGTAGMKYETVKELQGVKQLAKLDKDQALLLVEEKDGKLRLETVPLP